MDYENEARNIVRKWEMQYILDDLPREYDSILVRDIASVISNERDECIALINKWMGILSTTGELPVVDILRVIQSDLLQRGRDNGNERQIELPTLRESISSPSRT